MSGQNLVVKDGLFGENNYQTYMQDRSQAGSVKSSLYRNISVADKIEVPVDDEQQERIKNLQRRQLCLKLTGLIISLIIMPLQIILSEQIVNMENNIIKSLQKEFRNTEWFLQMANIIYYMIRTETQLIILIVLFLGSDSLLAFKSGIVYCMGIYAVMILKFLHQEPRPFWQCHEILPIGNHCDLAYASPSRHIFNVVFFQNYILYQYCWKFISTEKKSTCRQVFLIMISAIWTCLSALVLLFYASSYIYQSLLTSLYSAILFFLVVSFDKEVMNMAENTGFLLKPSRKYKFYLLFASIIMLIIAAMLVSGLEDVWVENHTYIQNVVEAQHKDPPLCNQRNKQQEVTDLGNRETFDDSAIVFFMVGMGFGTSMALTGNPAIQSRRVQNKPCRDGVSLIDWIYTPIHLKLCRIILGVAITLGTWYIFATTFTEEAGLEMSEYFFFHAVPKGLIGFFIYGPFVFLCQKIGLVKKYVEKEDEQDKLFSNKGQISIKNVDDDVSI